MILSIKQTKALDYLEDKVTNEVLYGGAAGGGKSRLGSYWLGKNCMKYKRSKWLMGRATGKTLRETTLQTLFEVLEDQKLKPGMHYKFNDIKGTVTFYNESQILLKDLAYYPTDPNYDELGSLEICGAFVDEVPQITKRCWNIVKSRVRHKRMAHYGMITKMFGSCNPDKGWVYSDFYKPMMDGKLPPNKQFVRALLSDNPFISPEYAINLASLDKNSRERLLHGNFEYDDDPASLIDFNKIMDVFTNRFVPATGQRYITCDVARFGSDSTVIAVWDGWRAEMYEYNGASTLETTNELQRLMIRNSVPLSNVLADEDGVGGGVVDFLHCQGFVNNSTPIPNPLTGEAENYNHLKSQCYYKLAHVINTSGLYIDSEKPDMRAKIVQELEQVKMHNMDKDGKKQILPKDKVKAIIGRSPDYSDTLAMRCWFDLAPRINWKPR